VPKALSIYLPGWPIWLARRRQADSPDPHVADSKRPDRAAWLLWTAQRGVRQVVHGCEQARAAGVQPGMSLAHANALCAGLRVHDQLVTPNEDSAALNRLARWLLRFAPVVSPDEPDGLMLDIAGCEKLFGGEREHVRQIGDALQRWGLRPSLAVAPTFACAWAVARHGDSKLKWIAENAMHEALSPLPVRALRVDPRTVDALADVGIERIEHLLGMPRDELAARFGAELLRRLDLATGAIDETIRTVRPARSYQASHAFDGPVRRLEIIEATSRELLSRLLQSLRTTHRGIRELTVELRRADCEPQSVSVRLTYPNRDAAHLWALLWRRLERAHLGFGVTEIILQAAQTERMKNEQAVFLREAVCEAPDPLASLGELVDRLVERLGSGAVTRVQPAESYVPEQAFTQATVHGVARPVSSLVRAEVCCLNPAHRPSRLLDRPEPIRVMSLVPDGPPVWLEWRGQVGEIVASIGPERIVSPWWTGRAAPPRDYYEAEDAHGRQLWVYRDGHTGQWFVHGQWI